MPHTMNSLAPIATKNIANIPSEPYAYFNTNGTITVLAMIGGNGASHLFFLNA